jgi:uncharacterized protein (TIGR02246 family)
MRSSNLVKNLSLTLAALAAFALQAAAQGRAVAGAAAADEAAVRENVRQMESGWNAKSGALFAKPFADDADYVVINGTQLKGREEIAQGHQRIFDTFYKESVISLAAVRVRFLRPDVAVAHVAARLKVPQPGGPAREADAVITVVMTKERGEWKIAAFQNTSVAAAR